MLNNALVPIGKVHVFDDDDQVEVAEGRFRQAVPIQPPRKRGRPAGTTSKIGQEHDLTHSDFCYLRATIQGIDARKAALRYLDGRVHPNTTACQKYESNLRAILQRTIKVVLDEAEHRTAVEQLEVLNAPLLKSVSLGPSLDDFALRFDSDMYSEAELQELYEEEFGTSAAELSQPENSANGFGIKAKLYAITWLSQRIAKKPNGHDPVEIWLQLSLVPKLRAHGIITLTDLMNWVNLQGRNFHLRINGFGETRARRLSVWLMDNEEHIGVRLNRRIRFQQLPAGSEIEDVEAKPSTALASVQEFRIIPIESLAWPAALLGSNGTFRKVGANTLGAANDREAIEAWFRTLKETASSATLLSYHRAVERLVLWAIVEKRTPLSSLVTEQFIQFREFLRSPPPHWCSRFPTVRTSPDWRPLKGPMKAASVQQTFSAVSALFSALSASGYLTANAVASVRTSVKRDLRMDVMRSFSEEDLQCIGRAMAEIPDGPTKRRLRAMFLLLQTGGFRRSEAASLTYGNLERVRKDNHVTDSWVARFVGKGGKERLVPIHPSTYAALEAHYHDRVDLMKEPPEAPGGGAGSKSRAPLAAYRDLKKADSPLLSILNDRFAEGRGAIAGETPGHASVKQNPTGALSSGRVHSILKAFFREVANRKDLPVQHAEFLKASAHWLRHTFGLQAMVASKGDLAAMQQIMGHSDIGTTGIYMKADLQSRVAVIEAIKGAV